MAGKRKNKRNGKRMIIIYRVFITIIAILVLLLGNWLAVGNIIYYRDSLTLFIGVILVDIFALYLLVRAW